MARFGDYPDIAVDIDGHIAVVEMKRPPHNYFDTILVKSMADAYEDIDRDTEVRVIVLAAEGRSFCAGAQLGNAPTRGDIGGEGPVPGGRRGGFRLYNEGVRLFQTETPVIAAVQGPAIGGGLGLALSADFRVASTEARFSANFARLGFHHGFGITETLPPLVGQQQAALLLYTGRRLKAEEAQAIGLCDMVVPHDELRTRALELAAEMAGSGPLAVRAIRRTLRAGLAERVRAATDREQVEQDWLRQTNDYREGVRAMAERREPTFEAR